MNKQMSSTEAFFCMKSTTWKCKYILSHYIELACMIQVFKLICFGLKQSGHMCRKNVTCFHRVTPHCFCFFFAFFVSEEKSN